MATCPTMRFEAEDNSEYAAVESTVETLASVW